MSQTAEEQRNSGLVACLLSLLNLCNTLKYISSFNRVSPTCSIVNYARILHQSTSEARKHFMYTGPAGPDAPWYAGPLSQYGPMVLSER